MEANLRFNGAETMETRVFGRLTAWQNWIFNPPQRGRREGRAQGVRQGREGAVRLNRVYDRVVPARPGPVGAREITLSQLRQGTIHAAHRLREKIPNNVNLAEDKTLQRALEQWQPNFINWWEDMGPEGSHGYDVYLRTAVSVDPSGWAHFDHVKMPDYRWGIFLTPGDAERKISFGEHKGEAAWQEVPGEHRANLRRIIVTQGDTEPASVEQQRHLGLTAPSHVRPAQPVPGQRRGGPPPVGDGVSAAALLRP